MPKISAIVFSFIVLQSVNAQFSEVDYDVKNKLPYLKFGFGAFSYNGAFNDFSNFGQMARFRSGYNVGIEKRFGKVLGAEFGYNSGKVATFRHTQEHFDNFETSFNQGELKINLHFDYILFPEEGLAPYITAGVGLMNFKTMSDLYDAQGNRYYLWSDGSLRSAEEGSGLLAQILVRDHVYDTDVTPSNSTTLTYMFGVGVKMQISNRVEWNTYYNRHFATNRFYEGENLNRNDGFSVIGTGFTIALSAFKGITKSEKSSSKQNSSKKKSSSSNAFFFTEEDFQQKSQESEKPQFTPEPEKNIESKIPESKFEKPDKTEKLEDKKTEPTKTTYETTKPIFGLPEEFKKADLNKDGKITVEEIRKAIDRLFEGVEGFDKDFVERLIEYYNSKK